MDNVNAIYARLNGPMPKSFCDWNHEKALMFKETVRMAKKAADSVPKKRTDSSVKGELYALESFWI